MAQVKKSTGSSAKASKTKVNSQAKNSTARKTNNVKKPTNAKKKTSKAEPIVLARAQKNDSWQPLVKSSRQSVSRTQASNASSKKKSGSRKTKKKSMTDSKLAAITIAAVFGAIFLIVLLVFLFNAFDLKLW